MISKIPNPTPHTFVRVCLGACNFATPRDLRLRGAGRGASQRHVAPLPHLHIRAGGVVQDIRWYWNNDHIATTTTIARLPRVPSATSRTTGTLERDAIRLDRWLSGRNRHRSTNVSLCIRKYFTPRGGHPRQFDRKIRESFGRSWMNCTGSSSSVGRL